MVQPGQAGEVLLRDGWSRLGGNQAVGVGRVSHHQHLRSDTNTLKWSFKRCKFSVQKKKKKQQRETINQTTDLGCKLFLGFFLVQKREKLASISQTNVIDHSK